MQKTDDVRVRERPFVGSGQVKRLSVLLPQFGLVASESLLLRLEVL